MAALSSGYTIEDPSEFAARVNSLMTGDGVPMPKPKKQPDVPVEAEVVETAAAPEAEAPSEAEPKA